MHVIPARPSHVCHREHRRQDEGTLPIFKQQKTEGAEESSMTHSKVFATMGNRNNFKLAAAVALLAVCSIGSYAQSTTDPAPAAQEPPAAGQSGPPPHNQWRGASGPDRELNQLARVLNLTPDQQKGVRSVLEQQGEQMRAMRQKAQNAASGDAAAAAETPEARRAQMEQLRDESNTKIAALLDENQKKTFADWTARRKAQMEQRRWQGGPSADGAGSPPPPPPSEN